MCKMKVGEPCPACDKPLQLRRSTFRTMVGDVAYCARCCSSFDLVREDDNALALTVPEFAPL